MQYIRSKMMLTCLLVLALQLAAAKKTSTKTQVDIRVVRSPQHKDTTTAYVVSQHARTEEGQSVEEPQQEEEKQQQVTVVSEEQYEALLKQAQKALQGYDLTKLSAAAHQAAPAVEYRMPKVVYKPEVQYKYVYAPAPAAMVYKAPAVAYQPIHKPATSVTYNTAPAAYGTYATHEPSTGEDDSAYGHYSKHKFGYRVSDPHTGAAFGHSEVSEGHVTRGHYHVLLPDGRLQNVKYVADPSGYHATVTYEQYKHY